MPDERTNSPKDLVLAAVQSLPDDAQVDEILDAILLQLKVERGREQIAAGQGLTTDQVRERLAKWLA